MGKKRIHFQTLLFFMVGFLLTSCSQTIDSPSLTHVVPTENILPSEFPRLTETPVLTEMPPTPTPEPTPTEVLPTPTEAPMQEHGGELAVVKTPTKAPEPTATEATAEHLGGDKVYGVVFGTSRGEGMIWYEEGVVSEYVGAIGVDKLQLTSPEEWELIKGDLEWSQYVPYQTGSIENDSLRDYLLVPVKLHSVHFDLTSPNPAVIAKRDLVVFEMPVQGGSIFTIQEIPKDNPNFLGQILDMNDGFSSDYFSTDKTLHYGDLPENMYSSRIYGPIDYAKMLKPMVGDQILAAFMVIDGNASSRDFLEALKQNNGDKIDDYKIVLDPLWVYTH